MPLSWTTLENAIAAAVRTASGYSTGQVLWADQSQAMPSGDFITLRLGDLVAAPVMVTAQTTAVGVTPGAEITHTFHGIREFRVSIQVFTSAVTGAASARAIAAKIQNSLVLRTVRDGLNTAGIGLLAVGDVRYMPEIKGTKFEARAVIEPRFSLIDTATEQTTFIETVNVEDYSGPPLGDPDTIDI